MLFEPVLLEPGERGKPGIGTVLLAAAFFVVEVGAAVRAKATAIAAADHLHGNREVDLLGQNVREEQALALEEGYLGIVQIQVKLFVGEGGHGAVVEIEIAADSLRPPFEAARANQFDAGVEVAVKADLALDKFRCCTDFERFYLPELTGVKIERAGRIAFPDSSFADSEFVTSKNIAFPRNSRRDASL